MNHSATAHRGILLATIMLATILQALDSTIAAVALPHMQGTFSATQEQVAWVLTSYIVASAITTPMAGFLTERLGRKRLYLLAVTGFTVTSMLCGVATSLEEMVLFRVLQGVFGAPLIPVAQATLLDNFPPQRQGSAMAMFGMGVMLGRSSARRWVHISPSTTTGAGCFSSTRRSVRSRSWVFNTVYTKHAAARNARSTISVLRFWASRSLHSN
jgi:MFS family permease